MESNQMLLRIVVLLLALGAVSAGVVPDQPFSQILSHQALYAEYVISPAQSVLPFKAPVVDALYDANGFCFVLLTEDGLLWSSRQERPHFPAGGGLENRYSSWKMVHDFSEFTSDSLALKFAKAPDSIVIVTSSQLIEVVMDFTCSELTSLLSRTDGLKEWGQVYDVTTGPAALWMGTDAGLLVVNMSKAEADVWVVGTVSAVPTDTAVTSLLYVESWDILFAGTISVLYELRFGKYPLLATGGKAVRIDHDSAAAQYTVHEEWIEGNIDKPAATMVYDSTLDCVWLVEEDAVHKRIIDGSWWRAGFYQGASTDNITSVSLDGTWRQDAHWGYIWLGTADKGLMRMRKDAADDRWGLGGEDFESSPDQWQTWQMFYGPRYTPDGQVKLLVSDALKESAVSSTTLVVTMKGVSFLTTDTWTLGQKAEVMLSFQYPRHDRNGIVAEVSLQNYVDLSSYYYNVEDSDSIWTGQYAVAAAMRYSFTKNEFDRKSAWRTFEALEMLGNVTGVPGLVGRTMCSPLERAGASSTPHYTSGCGMPEEGNWHESSSMPGWVWKGDTSSDTVNGHYFAYGVILDLVAKTAEEKARVINVIDRITSYIVENDLYYIDITGEPTKWGIWNPRDLNGNSDYVSERGVNSLEIMGFLALAYSVTEKSIYLDTFLNLATEHGYYENILNQKIDNPFDDNHSDNELGFLAYHTLFYAYQRLKRMGEAVNKDLLRQLEDMVAPVLPSIRRWYTIVRNERSPLWLAGAAGAAGLPASRREVELSVESLRLYSADLINYGIRNTGRWDCVVQPYYSRDNPTELQMSQIRPPQERMTGHFNANPFLMDSSYESSSAYDAGGGYTEYSPAEWLLPYYMLRFYGLLE